MMRTKPIQTTKWGTACAQCASAKAKCSGRLGNPGVKCDRCERLLKQCTDQIHRPRKTRQARQQSQVTDSGSPSFEFDSVVTTPEHPSSPMAGDLAPESASVGNQPSQDQPYLIRTTSSHRHQGAAGPFVTTPATYSAGSVYPPPGSVNRIRDMVLEGGEDLDQVLLSKYRGELMPQHPFVMLPHYVSASALRAHHPFLMLAIRVVASFEGLRSMHTRMQLVTGAMADRMFRQSERSLDLLMGIVVLLGWHHYNCAKHNQLNNLLCLAESLVSDLGLNRKPVSGNEDEEGERATEKKRLLLGVWYLRSSAAMHLQQLTSIPFTSYMRQCLAEIQETKAHELDEILVHFVKVQYLAERVAVLKSPQLKRIDIGHDRMSLEGGEQEKESPERGAALAGCQAYLDRLARELPSALKDNAMMVMQLNTVSLRLAEAQGTEVVHPSVTSTLSSSRLSFASDSPTIDTLLQTASVSIRCWFQWWMASVPVSRYRALPSHSVLQLLYALRAIIRNQPERSYMPGSAIPGSTTASTTTPAPTGRAGSHHAEDAAAILNRLISLGTTGADVHKFWAALGETYEDRSAHDAATTEHMSTPEDFPPTGDDAFRAMMAGRSQGSQSGSTDPYSMLHSQPMYPTNMFIPPSRVGSVGPGQQEYSGVSLLPSASVSAISGASHLPQPHPGSWTTPGTWGTSPSSWVAPGDPASMMAPERMDQRMWEAGQGNEQYGWEPNEREMRY